jgi:hypothetical protein
MAIVWVRYPDMCSWPLLARPWHSSHSKGQCNEYWTATPSSVSCQALVEDFRYHVSVLMKIQGECPEERQRQCMGRVRVPSERALSGHDQAWRAERLGIRLFSQQGLSGGCRGGFRGQVHLRGVKSADGSKSGRFPRSRGWSGGEAFMTREKAEGGWIPG